MVLPADSFIISNRTNLNEYDRKILFMLYQPLVGHTTIGLYYTMWSYLDKFELLSNEWTHNHILNDMMISIQEFSDARKKLEAIGLLKTYVKKGNINNYVYELYSPLSASEFINNPVLSTALYNTIGKLEYEKLINYFKIPKLNLREYENITSRFSDVFTFSSIPINDSIIYDLKKSRHRTLEILSKIDLNTIISLVPEELLNHTLTRDMKDYIYKIASIYDYDNDVMVELIRNSLTDSKKIDKKLLRSNAEKYYSFDHLGKLPSLIYKTQPEYLKKKTKDMSNRSKMIYLFESTSPYDFIRSKYKNSNPTSNDLKIVSYLLIDMNLKPGVVNVLVDYVLKINNNKLTKAYVEVIAGQWSKSNIETVEDAMNLAENEYKKRNNKKRVNKTTTKEVKKPNWLNQAIEEEMATDEELKALESRLNR
jgi:replication initiation and membrane attachment protein